MFITLITETSESIQSNFDILTFSPSDRLPQTRSNRILTEKRQTSHVWDHFRPENLKITSAKFKHNFRPRFLIKEDFADLYSILSSIVA